MHILVHYIGPCMQNQMCTYKNRYGNSESDSVLFSLSVKVKKQKKKYVPEHLWSKGTADVWFIKDIEPVSITPLPSFRLHQRQYPLKPKAEAGIGLLKQVL